VGEVVWAIAAGVPEIRAAEAVGQLLPVQGGWEATLAGGERVVFRRLYAGAELCRHLIPSEAEWAGVMAMAEARGVPVTLRTPPTEEADLAALEALLRVLDDASDAEVAANDWGALRLACRVAPDARRLLGRLLRRPRAATPDDLPGADAMPWEMQELLARWGVDLVEADRLPAAPSPVGLALHVPFELVLEGRPCPFTGLGRALVDKFRPDVPCGAPCRGLHARLDELVLRQTSLFARRDELAPALARPDVARIVYDLDADPERTFLRAAAGGAP
jgi:hypothetical protein